MNENECKLKNDTIALVVQSTQCAQKCNSYDHAQHGSKIAPDPNQNFAEILPKRSHENSKEYSRTEGKSCEITAVYFYLPGCKIYFPQASRLVDFSAKLIFIVDAGCSAV
jgi:hypothetical protein